MDLSETKQSLAKIIDSTRSRAMELPNAGEKAYLLAGLNAMSFILWHLEPDRTMKAVPDVCLTCGRPLHY
jgi:hypothetical protein